MNKGGLKALGDSQLKGVNGGDCDLPADVILALTLASCAVVGGIVAVAVVFSTPDRSAEYDRERALGDAPIRENDPIAENIQRERASQMQVSPEEQENIYNELNHRSGQGLL